MSIRTILVGASGGSASNGAIELACWFANRLDAHIEGFHVLLDPVAVFGPVGAGGGLVVSSDIVAEMIDEANANAANAKASFEEIADRYHLPIRILHIWRRSKIAVLRSVGARQLVTRPSS
jgi:nucleotide-binding universal stress UspA family protein